MPQTINDRYLLERQLGKGGFGEVFKAWDRELHRFVAIKLSRRQHVAISYNEQFLHEARVVAGLDHANIVPVYDVGCTPVGDRFVVSKFIDGNDLAKTLGTQTLSRNEAVKIVLDIAEALTHAHAKGLIHRDVKPANILIDRTGKTYLADFGISKYEEDLVKTKRRQARPLT